jgi:hypothetical protein
MNKKLFGLSHTDSLYFSNNDNVACSYMFLQSHVNGTPSKNYWRKEE